MMLQLQSYAGLSLSQGRGAAFFLFVSAGLLASFSWTSLRPGCDLLGETSARERSQRPRPGTSPAVAIGRRAPARAAAGCVQLFHFIYPWIILSPACKCLAFCCFTASFWGPFQHWPRVAERGDSAPRRAKYGVPDSRQPWSFPRAISTFRRWTLRARSKSAMAP